MRIDHRGILNNSLYKLRSPYCFSTARQLRALKINLLSPQHSFLLKKNAIENQGLFFSVV